MNPREHPTWLSVPTVSVAAALPKRSVAGSVLIVPVVSVGDDDPKAMVVAGSFLPADAVSEIEAALKALGAKGAASS